MQTRIPSWLLALFPFFRWLRRTSRETLTHDALAGLTSAAIVLPQAIACAEIAGLPPQYGLYSAIVIPIIASLYGSSWHLVSGPTTAISIVVFATLSMSHVPGSPSYLTAAITITFLVGVIQLALGFARLGQLMNFVSHSVLIGFTSGAAVLIALSQIEVLLGQDFAELRGDLESAFAVLWQSLVGANLYVIGLAAVTLVAAVLSKKIAPRLPNYLIGMIVGSVAAWLVGAREHGVRFVQSIDSALPPFSMPDLNIDAVQSLSQGAFAIALIGLLEAVSISRALASRTGQRVNSKQEIIGQGLSNVIGSMFSSYAGSGSFTRSGLNYEAGARTPLATIFASVLVLVLVMALISFITYLPIPVIAGLIILIAWRLIDIRQIRHIFATSASESLIFGFTILSALIINLELAIFGGIILSLCVFLRRTMQTDVPIWAPNQASQHRSFVSSARSGVTECPQAVFARLQGPLYFGALEGLQATFREIEDTRPDQMHLVLGIDGSIGMDLSGAEFLIDEAHRRRTRGGGLYLIVKYPRLRAQVSRYGLARELGAGHIFRRKSEAIPRLIPRLDPKICETCKARIFLECPPAPSQFAPGSDESTDTKGVDDGLGSPSRRHLCQVDPDRIRRNWL